MKYLKNKNEYVVSGNHSSRKGSALVLVTVCIVILSTLGLGMLAVSYGVRHNAIKLKNETIAMLAAEAGYEQAVFWMSQQKDMLSSLYSEDTGTIGTLNVPQGSCDYKVGLYTFVGSRPVYRIVSNGHSGSFTRTVDVLVLQATSGWDMGKCEVPTGSTSTTKVYFANGEIIDMPLHINDFEDVPDTIDIHIKGDPQFLQAVSMGESRYAGGAGADKYASVISTFDNGIYFNQPNNKVTDEDIVQDKIDRFKNSTKLLYRFTPVATASVSNSYAAVQLEFFVEDGVGKIRITEDCTVRGQYPNNYDYKAVPGSDGSKFEKYYIYGCHYMQDDAVATGKRFTVQVDETYVTQDFGGVESEPGGQIYIDGNVVIGGDKTEHNGDQLVNGRITVVATGNIWIADSVLLDGPHDPNGKPSQENTNILGLVAQGVIKVVDPGISDQIGGSSVIITRRGRRSSSSSSSGGIEVAGHEYVPIGRSDGSEEYDRVLPDPMVVEAALTVGGGGWGAENVGSRKEDNSPQDDLVLRGTITEVIRGVVGLIGYDGYLKYYYFDERVLEGILPGDIWLQGKFIPAPAGWQDYRVALKD